MPVGSREGLLAAAQAGDRAAFDELLAGQRSHALASALRVLHNPDDAEDAVQDAFVKIWYQLARFEGRSSFATWVHRIVVNASLDLLRKSAARPQLLERTEQQHDLAESSGTERACEQNPESELGRCEIARMVRLAVAELSPAHRQAVELHELEDCPCQEIAALAGCPVGTIMSRLHDARARLADALPAELLADLAA
jgi:RNA polymerase sigma-70 factor (ECF subfamily)